jgi:hypothetical protein
LNEILRKEVFVQARIITKSRREQMSDTREQIQSDHPTWSKDEVEGKWKTLRDSEFLSRAILNLGNPHFAEEEAERREALSRVPIPNTKPETPSGKYENQVFIRKAEGMPFEEFKIACVKLFREKGLIKDKVPE